MQLFSKLINSDISCNLSFYYLHAIETFLTLAHDSREFNSTRLDSLVTICHYKNNSSKCNSVYAYTEKNYLKRTTSHSEYLFNEIKFSFPSFVLAFNYISTAWSTNPHIFTLYTLHFELNKLSHFSAFLPKSIHSTIHFVQCPQEICKKEKNWERNYFNQNHYVYEKLTCNIHTMQMNSKCSSHCDELKFHRNKMASTVIIVSWLLWSLNGNKMQ